MAEKQKETKQKEAKQKEVKPREKQKEERDEHEILVRVLGYDMPGSKNILTGLTRIKGVSWAIAKLVCTRLNFPLSKKVSELSKEEIKKIESFFEKPDMPEFLKNRRKDIDTGESMHIYGHNLSIKTEFDIKRLKKMRCYKGIRHSFGLPVRGQKTRSHFRTRGKSVGVRRSKK